MEAHMNSEKKPTITLAPDGPYIVKALTRLSNKNGPVECKETMALCRCGASANKPFCDGTHAKIGFSSAKIDNRTENSKESYRGKNITIHDNRGVCAHAGVCTDNLSEVFRMKQEPWIDADAASVEDIINTIKSCPSGALSYSINNTENQDDADLEPNIFIAKNGPYVVSAGEGLLDTNWGEGASKSKYTLCRCGASKNKPFCDGSHWGIEFSDDEN